MENLVAMVVITAAIFLSKRNAIPVIIICYYALYGGLQSVTIGWITDYLPVTKMPFDLAAIHYLFAVAIELLIIILLCLNTSQYRNIAIFYAIMVLISMAFNAIQAFSMTIESNWFIDFYTIRQQIAIPLDITVAWLGSDNFVSRRLGITRDSDNIDSNATNRYRAN